MLPKALLHPSCIILVKMAEAFRQEDREVENAHREKVAWEREEEEHRVGPPLEMEVEGRPLVQEDRPFQAADAAVPCEEEAHYSLAGVQQHVHKKEAVVDPSEVDPSIPEAGLALRLRLPQAVE
jgi:hypothetical protein